MIRTFRGGLRTIPAQVQNLGVGADLEPPLNRAISGRLNWEWSHWRIQLTLNCGVELEGELALCDQGLRDLWNYSNYSAFSAYRNYWGPSELQQLQRLQEILGTTAPTKLSEALPKIQHLQRLQAWAPTPSP